MGGDLQYVCIGKVNNILKLRRNVKLIFLYYERNWYMQCFGENILHFKHEIS
jgi:hypothetical protein